MNMWATMWTCHDWLLCSKQFFALEDVNTLVFGNEPHLLHPQLFFFNLVCDTFQPSSSFGFRSAIRNGNLNEWIHDGDIYERRIRNSSAIFFLTNWSLCLLHPPVMQWRRTHIYLPFTMFDSSDGDETHSVDMHWHSTCIEKKFVDLWKLQLSSEKKNSWKTSQFFNLLACLAKVYFL